MSNSNGRVVCILLMRYICYPMILYLFVVVYKLKYFPQLSRESLVRRCGFVHKLCYSYQSCTFVRFRAFGIVRCWHLLCDGHGNYRQLSPSPSLQFNNIKLELMPSGLPCLSLCLLLNPLL